MTARLELEDMQGLIVRGYANLPCATFLLLQVEQAEAARTTLSSWSDQLTSAGVSPRNTAMNIALTAEGVLRLTGWQTLPAGFSHPFASGMTSPYRSRLLGDVGEDAPTGWRWGGPATDRVDLLVLLYAEDLTLLASQLRRLLEEAERGGLRPVEQLATDPLVDTEHFGFRDGISQPTIEGLPRAQHDFDVVRAGEFILGYLNEYGQRTERPLVPRHDDRAGLLPRDADGSGAADLGRNGSYLVFRHLSQDVDGFWGYMEAEAQRQGVGGPQDAVRLAAKFVGRWPSGAPLVLSPDHDEPDLGGENSFGYHRSDPVGMACPIGSHIRRTNPRDSLEPSPGTARSWEVNRRHRLLRRGRTYSDKLAPEGTTDRGVHFLCLNANLARQYEFVQHSWVNDPAFNNLDHADDPLIGSRGHGPSLFVEPARPIRRRHHDVPKFVRVRGGAYFFLPSVAALRYLSAGR